MTDLRLGRLPDNPALPKLDLTAFAASADFSMVPDVADYIDVGGWQMLGNNMWGDCLSVRWANHRRLMGAPYPNLGQVLDFYRTQNPGFDPSGDPTVNGPGSPADHGMSSDLALAYLHKQGGPDGARVVAYGKIDPQNVRAVERAIGAFGAVWVDILVQPGNQAEFQSGAAWTDTGEMPVGGHAVLGGAYVPQRRIVTWGDVAELGDSFWSGMTPAGPLVQSVYLVVWPEHATHQFIRSETGALLEAQYLALTGRPLAWPATHPAPRRRPWWMFW